MKVTVFQTLQSGTNEPVEVAWSRNTTPVGAAACVATLLQRAAEPDTNVPESVRARTLSIRVEITEEKDA